LVLILLIIGFLSFSWFFFLSILSLNILFNFFFRFSSHLLNYSLFFIIFLICFYLSTFYFIFFIEFFLSFYFSIKSLIIFFHSVLIILITTCVSF
jgi:hypothetical protein